MNNPRRTAHNQEIGQGRRRYRFLLDLTSLEPARETRAVRIIETGYGSDHRTAREVVIPDPLLPAAISILRRALTEFRETPVEDEEDRS